MGGLPNEPIPDTHVSQTEGSKIGDHRLNTTRRSSRGLINIVVMTLFVLEQYYVRIYKRCFASVVKGEQGEKSDVLFK